MVWIPAFAGMTMVWIPAFAEMTLVWIPAFAAMTATLRAVPASRFLSFAVPEPCPLPPEPSQFLPPEPFGC